MDSHGNGLDPKKIYRNKDIQINVLGKGEKNIKGAISFCMSKNLPKHLILGVGNNDLDKNETSFCVREMTRLINFVRNKSKSCIIHILPAFDRVNKPEFNTKVQNFNNDVGNFCSQIDNCHLIENSLISSAHKALFSDGVHFSVSGQKSLVRIVKRHLNPFLGMKPYSEYIRGKNKSSATNRRVQFGRNNNNRSGLNDNNSKLNQILRELAKLTN